MTLDERIDAAIKRITSGHGPMRIPADPTDPDLVLAECKARLAEVERERDEARTSLASMRRQRDEWENSHDAACAQWDAEKQRADRAESTVQRLYDGDSGAECAVCERITANGICTQCRHRTSPLVKARDERDAALAAVAELRAALVDATKSLQSLSKRKMVDDDEVRVFALARARVAEHALASNTLGAGWVSPERLRELMEKAWDAAFGLEEADIDVRAMRKADIDALLAEVA